jgi:hypothetical protein
VTLEPKLETLNQEYRKGIPCIVVANKIDLDMKVTKKSFNFAAKRNIPFYFVSASEVSISDCCLRISFHSALSLLQRSLQVSPLHYFSSMHISLLPTSPQKNLSLSRIKIPNHLWNLISCTRALTQGTNVVKVFNEAIEKGLKYQENPDA